MSETKHHAIKRMDVALFVQAMITLILTVTVIALVAVGRDVPDVIMTVWLVSIGLWLPLPDRIQSR